MDVNTFNILLSAGQIDREDMWPRLVEAEAKASYFFFRFGLDKLPLEPGLITIRGPRQYGKSTWLDYQVRDTIKEFGKGTAFYINGDDLTNDEELLQQIIVLRNNFTKKAKVKRIFIDEITAISNWERAIKRLWDRGETRDILIVTTGSKASDLRHGSERLPGRKGNLPKTEYIFLPVSYQQFYEQCGQHLEDKTWIAYLLSGGSPIACNDICQFEKLPEYFLQLTKDWILGEVVESGRNRIFLTTLLRNLYRFGGTPVGYAKLARESGLANNTVAAGYVEQLSDLLCVMPTWQWDGNEKIHLLRKPCKFNFINLAAAVSFHRAGLRHIEDFELLASSEKAILLEWFVAQELWRRAVLANVDNPEAIGFWRNQEHEVDFVSPQQEFVEVKLGKTNPLEFNWFNKIFPKTKLTVISDSEFETDYIRSVSIHNFLLEGPP